MVENNVRTNKNTNKTNTKKIAIYQPLMAVYIVYTNKRINTKKLNKVYIKTYKKMYFKEDI